MSGAPATTVQWLRTAVDRIGVGSGRRAVYLSQWALHRARRVWQRAHGWLSQGEGVGWLLRAGVLLAAAAVLRKVVFGLGAGLWRRIDDGGSPWLLAGAALGWLVSAYRAGAKDWKPKRPAAPQPAGNDNATQDSGEQPDAPATEQTPAGPPPVSTVELVATVRDIGTPHAQLKPIAEYLRTTTDAVRAAAAELRWPIKDVRMQGRSASAGLRWDECPDPRSAHPSRGVVGAGHRADDNDDDGAGDGPEKGLRVEAIGHGGRLVYDPTDVIRHHKPNQ
jgi:hypothetical protein